MRIHAQCSRRLPAGGLLILALGMVVSCSAPKAADKEVDSSAMGTISGHNAPKAEVGQKKAVDPVCGMTVEEGVVVTYNGKAYHFCSEYCAESFKKNPEKYLPASADSKGAAGPAESPQ